jgi:hypothetical protein
LRYGPNRYSTSDPGASSTIYGLSLQFAESSWYSTLANLDACFIFTDQSIKRHAHNHRQFQSTYSMTALVDYEPYAEQCGDIMLSASPRSRVLDGNLICDSSSNAMHLMLLGSLLMENGLLSSIMMLTLGYHWRPRGSSPIRNVDRHLFQVAPF